MSPCEIPAAPPNERRYPDTLFDIAVPFDDEPLPAEGLNNAPAGPLPRRVRPLY
jgi:hypothetical protein